MTLAMMWRPDAALMSRDWKAIEDLKLETTFDKNRCYQNDPIFPDRRPFYHLWPDVPTAIKHHRSASSLPECD
jgi:hypothetical protein